MNTGIIQRAGIAMLFGPLLVCLAATVFAASKGPLKVVYDVAVDTPEAVDNVLARSSHLSDLSGADPIDGSIVIVLRGNEVAFFTKVNYDTYKGIVDRAKSLSTGGIIVIRMSELALKVRGIDADEVHDFIEIVPFGDAEIARLQTGEGHAYLQAHNLVP